jgi:two-component system sensor histidine kinase BaeS
MRRRITLTIVGVVAGALVISGLVSLLLTARSERKRAEAEVTRQAQGLAAGTEGAARVGAFANLSRVLKLDDLRLVAITPRFQGQLPAGVTQADIQPSQLAQGVTVHGRNGTLVFAAAPTRARNGTVLAFVLTRTTSRLPPSTGYFLLSGAIALVVAAVIGDQLGRRIARPLQEAEVVTKRIAGGDLTATVPVERGADDEIASLADSINTMAAALARSRGLERQFLMSVSHDLRTPLTSIRGFAEAIADGAASDDRRAAEVIGAESRRLERLVGDLLDLAKLDAKQFSLDIGPVDLTDVVAATADGFQPAADGYGLTIDVQPAGPTTGGPVVRADPDRLAQVVANLVENALKYAGQRIVVRTFDGPMPGVAVEDDGPGIPTADLPYVFERMHTAARVPARQVGSGLGLAIVSELVGAMGGAVRAESPTSAAGGTRMVVTLAPAPRF